MAAAAGDVRYERDIYTWLTALELSQYYFIFKAAGMEKIKVRWWHMPHALSQHACTFPLTSGGASVSRRHAIDAAARSCLVHAVALLYMLMCVVLLAVSSLPYLGLRRTCCTSTPRTCAASAWRIPHTCPG